jgi:flagellar motor switch protein FliN/FliY
MPPSVSSGATNAPAPAGGAASGARSRGPSGKEVEDADRPLKQAEIDRLLEQAGLARPKKPAAAASPPPVTASAQEETLSPRDVEFLLEQAERALRSVEEEGPGAQRTKPELKPFEFEQFASPATPTEAASIDLVGEVELEVRIELGQTRMHLEDVLKLRKGSVVTLDRLAGDPVDIYVNGRLVARGEVLVLNDNFCVRVAELVAPK